MSIAEQLQNFDQEGFAVLVASSVEGRLSAEARKEMPQVEASFHHLVRDTQMADGGTYRFRRYGRFLARKSAHGFDFTPLSGHSIYQEVRDNPLNGGVTRTFEPLSQEINRGHFLHSLMSVDAELLASHEPELFDGDVVVGVHQVRIVARPENQGMPTPEGIHRDAERYTFQHFWSRTQADGGVFVAYDSDKKERFRWLQQNRLDSVLFKGTTWHSATPIVCELGAREGYRDIFLIDFDLPG